jgi:hypothetical protein
MLNSDLPTRGIVRVRSWPVNVVAIAFLLQGLQLAYDASLYGRAVVQPKFFGVLESAVLNGVIGVVMIITGLGLLARIKAFLTVAVVLAGMYLASAGDALVGGIFVLTISPVVFLSALALVVAGWLQYAILRHPSTISLFSQP